MEVGLGWLGVGVGVVGSTLTYWLARGSVSGEQRISSRDESRRAWLCAALTLLLTLIFWVVSKRSDPPFSSGQTLGWGFLIGGAFGAMVCVLSNRMNVIASAESLRTRYLLCFTAAFHALAFVSLAYVLFHGDPVNALIGFAIGAVMAAIVRFYLQGIRAGSDDLMMQAWALFAVTIAASIVLAVSHFDSTVQRIWWPLPILMAVTATVAGFVATEIGAARRLDARPGASVVLSCFIGAIIVTGLSAIYAWRLVQDWRLLEVTVVGVACISVAAWLIASTLKRTGSAFGLDTASACVLILIAFAVVAFKLWAGLGIGIGLVAAWSIALPVLALRGDESGDAIPRAVSMFLFVGLSILLYRVFVQTYRHDVSRTDLPVHYSFIGALIGAILPFVLASSTHRLKDCASAREGVRGDLCALAGAASIGLFAAASPVVIYLVWELKAVVGLIYGLVASGAFLLLTELFTQSTPAERRGPSLSDCSTGLLVIGAQLVAIQFVKPLMELTTTRAVQITVLSVAAVLAILWFLVIGISSRRGER